MGLNVLVGGQLEHLTLQYQNLLRKQVAQECYKLEFLLGQLKKFEAATEFDQRKHRVVYSAAKEYNRHHNYAAAPSNYVAPPKNKKKVCPECSLPDCSMPLECCKT
ncbi:MAG: hypothetical protein KVP17_000360 [Porospora cf. gigantea B]|uniref:uncharacterized protein n=1 Tax=Porospora cf. gigantea B TaxID=2853592 RepID=UPI003571DA90|nr:MAG: hypothetical protein KVP17_000360 [Porospora cf. gigantea B]